MVPALAHLDVAEGDAVVVGDLARLHQAAELYCTRLIAEAGDTLRPSRTRLCAQVNSMFWAPSGIRASARIGPRRRAE